MGSRLLKLIAVFAIFSVTFLPLSLAQKTTGDISGTVSDQSGAALPGSALTLTDQATGAVRKTTADAQGNFSFLQVPVGTYTLTGTKEGFKTLTQKDVSVHIASVTTTAVRLEVGATTETVTVEAAAINLNTENGEVGNVMLSNQVSQLPLNGRNFIELTTLMPGASVGGGFDNKNKGLLAGVDISFSGAPANANQWQVNGANNNDQGSQRTILVYPSVDAIQEFKILRNSYGPEYGGAGGAQINIVTQSGGNQFHGRAYYFGRNDVLNAENFFLGQQKLGCVPGDPVCGKKNFLRRNDYGFTIGGPIKKDKAFFFWSEEWNRERRGQVRQAWIPTMAEQGGDFSDLAAARIAAGADPTLDPFLTKKPDPQNPGQTLPVTCGGPAMPRDPNTGQPFPGYLIPGAQLSPAGQAYLSQLPAPNITDLCASHDWVSQVGIPLDWREDMVNGSYNLTKSTALMINFTNESWVNPLHGYNEGGLWGDSNWPAVSDSWSQPSKMLVAKLTSTLGSNKVNDFAFSWSANRINITQAGDNPKLQQQIVSAMPLIFPTSGKLHPSQLPEQICWCSTYLGTLGPWNNRQDLFTWKDDFSITKGSHTLKMGVLYDQNAKDEEQGDEAGGMWGAAGYVYSAAQRTTPGPSLSDSTGGFAWSSPTGNQWSDTILQNVMWGINENSKNLISEPRWRDVEFYFGDNWKATKRLTLDYGVRYSLMPDAWLADDKLAAFDPSAYDPALGTSPCNGIVLAKGAPNGCSAQGFAGGVYSKNRSIVPSNYHLFAPRIGFAYDVTGRGTWVVRAGIGQFFTRDPISGTSTRLVGANPPFTIGTGAERTLDGPAYSPGVNMLDFSSGGTGTQSVQISPNLANSWQWNLTTEVAPFRNAKLEVGYVALRGIHLATYVDIDQLAPQNRLAWLTRASGDNANGLFPFGAKYGGAPGAIYQWSHYGDSIYHSLQSQFTLKLSRNSIFQTSYTWSKNIANTEGDYPNNQDGIADLYDTRASRGLSNFDRTNVFSSSLVYNLPTLDGKNGLLKGVAGGWETSTVVSIATGNALTITGGLQGTTCVSLAGGTPCTGTLGADPWGAVGNGAFTNLSVRPLMTGGDCFSGNKLQYIDPNTFTMNGYAIGQRPFGNTGQCHGPAIRDVDFALDKNWSMPKALGENTKLQFRLEFFNLFNHPMFRYGSSSLDSNQNLHYVGTGGQVVNGIVTGSTLQAGSTFGNTPFSSNLGNREIQYALKLIF
ncbi:MAG TPA: carboxypeptidase-like regulatory domain-containing protein [Terriglobales bacterium]|nr:carboxypeptidase-like regulatory domain-containing protein [Terriglobales bacterium]